MPSNLIIGNGLTKIEKIREFDPAYGMTEDEIIREFYDPPYKPPRQNRPYVEKAIQSKPEFKVMPIQLPNRNRSEVQVNTSTNNSALGRRRKMMQAQREARELLLKGSKL